jgi:hypothetical protein
MKREMSHVARGLLVRCLLDRGELHGVRLVM